MLSIIKARIYVNTKKLFRWLSSTTDFLVWLILDPSKFRPIRRKKVKKLLVVILHKEIGNAGGDFCILGTLNQLKYQFPKVKISVLCDPKTFNQFGKVKGIELIRFEGKDTIEDIREEGFDSVFLVDLGPLTPRDFSFIENRVMHTTTTPRGILELRKRFFVTRKVFIPPNLHMVDSQFKALEKIGFNVHRNLRFPISKKEKRKVDQILRKEKISNFVVIHPGGKQMVDSLEKGNWPPHLWPLERYAKVADYFSKIGYHIIITGTEKESYLAEKIMEFSNSTKLKNMCGAFSLKEIGRLLERGKLLLAADTSIVHIAYQVGTPIIDLMGPSIPKVVGPWPLDDPKHVVLFDDGPYSHSMLKTKSPEKIKPLERIKIRDVIEASKKFL